MRLWRYAVITHLGAALKADVLNSDLNKHKLQTPPPMRDIRCGSSISPKSYRSHILEIRGAYVRRPPIASWRLLKVTNQEVEFVAKDTKAKRLVRTRCELSDFVRLLAQHVPMNMM